ncbi:O-antigen ligase family protein [Bombilactobacillus bombi]|uniref:O-antigen ligase family protein n=1 Tax=Bombilactobacillus bombi TaxID=1303590 RepID=UPI0015E5D5D4|nr:O-antigen ligase family protein [Bombilactobacillus bombi]
MKKINLNKFSVLLVLYLLIQPLLDVITGWQVKLLPHFGLTVGVVVRAIMLVVILYFINLAAKARANWFDRHLWQYFLLLVIIIVINLVVNKFNKPVFATFTELSAIFKSVHYLVILIGFYYVFRNLRAKQIKALIPTVIYWAQMIVNVVMLAASLTNSGFATYDQGKVGQTGWFNAGNELGAILAITFPLVILYALQKSQEQGQFWSWIGVVLSVISIIMVGTKSCFYGMLIGLFFALIYQILAYRFWSLSKIAKKSLKINFLITCLLGLSIAVVYPASPVHTNSVIQAKIIKNNQLNKKKLLRKSRHKKHLDHYERFLLSNNELSNPLLAKLLSGRTNYFNFNSRHFAKAPLIQKLFGMGYGSNYKKHPRTVEMDLFDLFFQFGIIGFIVVILPLLVSLLYLAFQLLRHWTSRNIQTNLLYFAAIAIGIFMSVLAGHVLNAPAVNIYFSFICAYLLVMVQEPTTYSNSRFYNNETIG